MVGVALGSQVRLPGSGGLTADAVVRFIACPQALFATLTIVSLLLQPPSLYSRTWSGHSPEGSQSQLQEPP